ncbi:hypothetical protein BRADI_3g20103v3 [Brachypodium distachyon]|uniref:Uncharacterized protein n=1 Tax=Brachypodium distachyon TaxID=15368 RepID=A0A2K2CYG1_BRADI|nr:hypothetical protein BRADI_3g20103v3 [Brachypodium distachyon]
MESHGVLMRCRGKMTKGLQPNYRCMENFSVLCLRPPQHVRYALTNQRCWDRSSPQKWLQPAGCGGQTSMVRRMERSAARRLCSPR